VITNLIDDIDVFSLPNIAHLGIIKQKFQPNFSITIDVILLGARHIVSSGHGQVWMNEADTLHFIWTS